jgi:hypothetical protein
VRIALARCTEPVPPLPRVCRVPIFPRHLLQRLTGRHNARPGGGELPALTAGVQVRTSRCWPAAEAIASLAVACGPPRRSHLRRRIRLQHRERGQEPVRDVR